MYASIGVLGEECIDFVIAVITLVLDAIIDIFFPFSIVSSKCAKHY